MQKAFFKHYHKNLLRILKTASCGFKSVLTVHNVEGSHGGFVVQGKRENLVGVGQISGRAGREDGDLGPPATDLRMASRSFMQATMYQKKPGYFVFPDGSRISFLVPEPVSRIIKGSLENQRNQGVPESIFADNTVDREWQLQVYL